MDINNILQSNTHKGCSCQRPKNACGDSCAKLKKQLMAVCFALDEVVLYLDVYPDSHEALCYYHNLLEEKKRLSAEYEMSCAPLNAYGNTSKSSWDWIKSPWPWKYEANN